MNTQRIRALVTTGLGLMTLLTGNAHAQATTDTLLGWNVLGDAVSQGGALTLTTAFVDGTGGEIYNLSGHAAVDADLIAHAAAVPFTALNPNDFEFATEGSLASQSFAVMAGQTLSFDWSFATHETLYLDHAFAVVDGRLFTLATTAQPGGASQTFSYRFANDGQARFAVGVVDTVDTDGVSSLTVGNLAFSTVAAVPEPATNAMLLTGLGVIGFIAVRRREQKRR